MKLEDEYRLRAECAERKLEEDHVDFQRLCVDVRALEEALMQEHAGPSTGRVVYRWLRLKFWRAVNRRRRTNISGSRLAPPLPERTELAYDRAGPTHEDMQALSGYAATSGRLNAQANAIAMGNLTADGYERMINCELELRSDQMENWMSEAMSGHWTKR
jgi:hypothetical protein